MSTICIVAGARPNFMKVAPILRALEERPGTFETILVHTGQHYDYEMSKVFFEQLAIREPDVFLNTGSGTHAAQTADVMVRIESLLQRRRPDLLTVVGDVNSTIAASLAAAKLGVPVAHVEAGLRSGDRSMPEEINRVLTDHISSLLLVSEPAGVANLAQEGIEGAGVHLVGNTMIDSLVFGLKRIRTCGAKERFELGEDEYAIVTIHRPSNVDKPEAMRTILSILQESASRLRLVFPVHPRAVGKMDEFGLRTFFEAIPNLTMTEPLGYFDFMNLVLDARCVMTDSGGIQEETTWLGIPCITLRDNTERPLTLSEGTNELVGQDLDKVHAALDRAQRFDSDAYSSPALWDGKAANRIAEIFSRI